MSSYVFYTLCFKEQAIVLTQYHHSAGGQPSEIFACGGWGTYHVSFSKKTCKMKYGFEG